MLQRVSAVSSHMDRKHGNNNGSGSGTQRRKFKGGESLDNTYPVRLFLNLIRITMMMMCPSPAHKQAACSPGVPIDLELRIQDGYDHSYYFIASFIDDHLRHHAKHLLWQNWASPAKYFLGESQWTRKFLMLDFCYRSYQKLTQIVLGRSVVNTYGFYSTVRHTENIMFHSNLFFMHSLQPPVVVHTWWGRYMWKVESKSFFKNESFIYWQ